MIAPKTLRPVYLYHFLFLCVVGATTKVHIVYLGENQNHDLSLTSDSHHELLASVVGSKKEASKLLVYSYKHGFSGFAAKLTDYQVQKLAVLPGVLRIIPNNIHWLQTTRSLDFLGLSSFSRDNLLHRSSLGDGVIIGIFDTGIWPESESFSSNEIGSIPQRWKGSCESGEMFNKTIHCTRKIIGGRWYIKGFLAEYGKPLNTTETPEFLSPRDANGHGTHTASTAAGSLEGNVSYKGLAGGTARGGAPRARLAIYKVCWNVLGGQCSSADILKAFDDAISDGVDVLSLSIGSAIPLFSDVDERDGIATGSFHAVVRGITVVCGAGNDGPSSQSVQNTAPWILTVAASTLDRAFPTSITLGSNQTLSGEALFRGKEIGFTGLVYPESMTLDTTAAGECQSLSLNGSSVFGSVVLCFASLSRRVSIPSAGRVVQAAGGAGLIVARHPTDALTQCIKDFPCVEVDIEIGTRILFYIRSTNMGCGVAFSAAERIATLSQPKAEARVARCCSYAQHGDLFRAKGPRKPERSNPDIAAPGTSILAATSPFDRLEDKGYAMHSGTSMATPHVSGIVVLLKALHPRWSPAAIKSALVTTARRRDHLGFPVFAEGSPRKLADPFDLGGGIVDPNAAADPGLVYDMDKADYVHYLCAVGYNNSAISKLIGNQTNCPQNRPSMLDLNLPSITIPSLRSTVSLTRTVTNVGASKSIYTAVVESPFGVFVSVRPSVLVFTSLNQKMSFTVTTSTLYKVNSGGYLFGCLTWTDGIHAVRTPLSVKTHILSV